MANSLTNTKQRFSLVQLIALTEGLEHYFPSADPSNAYINDSWTDFNRVYTWNDRQSFLKTLAEATGIGKQSEIKVATDILYKMINTYEAPTMTEAPEYAVDSNTLSPDKLKQFQEEEKIASAKHKETVENAKADIQRAIDKQTELREKLKGQKLYAKVTPPPEEPPKDIKKLDKLKNLAKEAPHQLQADLENQILERVSGLTSPEDAKVIAKKVSYDIVAGLNSPDSASASQQTAILSALAKDQSVDPELRSAAENLAFFQNSDLLSRQIVSSFNPDLANAVFGPDPDSFRVHISASQMEGFTHSIDTPSLSGGYSDLLRGQSRMLDSISSFGTREIKQVFLTFGRAQLDKLVASLPADSMVSALYRSAGAQQALEYFGLTKSFALSESFAGQMILKIPGASPLFEGLGKMFGVDVIGSVAGTGVKTAALAAGETAAAGAATTAITTGGAAAAEGAAVAAGAAAAPATGGLSLVVAAAASIVGPKVLKFIKDNLYRIKDFIVGAGGAVLGGAIGAASGVGIVGGSIIGGLGGFGLSRFLSGGLSGVQASASSIARGALNAGWIIGATALAGMGTPILVTLLVFPVVVALILFIINSGAYVVPPSASTSAAGAVVSPYIDVVKTANPAGPFDNNNLPLTVEYTIQIKAKKGPLSNVKINYSCQVISKSGTSVTCPKIDGEIPQSVTSGISPSSAFTFSYKQNYGQGYSDSFITDTISVYADAAGAKGEEAAGSATIKIGNPPENCPSIWPTNKGNITQGAYTTSTHSSLEALDVSVSHVGVLSTHSGVVVRAQNDSCYGNNIEIKSVCSGKEFVSRYAHLEGIGVKVGQAVTMGQQIGLSGNTTGGKPSCSTGAHLHYDFHYWPSFVSTRYPGSPPFMVRPYTPLDVKRGCVLNCFVSW